MTLATPERSSRSSAAEPERFPGALLLTGPSEARLEEESRRIAARLLCPGNDPRAECGSCRRVHARDPSRLSLRRARGRPDQGRPRAGSAGVRRRTSLRERPPRRTDPARRGARRRGRQRAPEVARGAGRAVPVDPDDEPARVAPADHPLALHGRGPAGRERRPRGAAAWVDRGFSEDDARDLVLFAGEDGEPRPRRAPRGGPGAAPGGRLRARGGAHGGPARRARRAGRGRRFAREARRPACSPRILADAALAAEAPQSQALRHLPVAGKLAEIARRIGPAALRDAALAAADPPPDNRRGNRRLHYEKVLLGLWGRSVAAEGGQVSFSALTGVRSRFFGPRLGRRRKPESSRGLRKKRDLTPERKTRRNDGEPPAQRARKDREECGPGSYQTDGRCGKLGWQTPPSPPLP